MAYIKANELFNQWRSQIYKPAYILAGEETYLLEEAWRYLEKKLGTDSLNREIFYANEAQVDEIILATQTLPFLSERRLLVVKEAHRLRAAEMEKLAEFLKKPVASSCLVFLWSERLKKDSRKSDLFAAVEKAGDIVEYRALYDREFPAWVQQKLKEHAKTIAGDAVQSLIQESGSSLLDLSNEIEKLTLFTGARSQITVKDVEIVSGHTRLANLNALAEAVESRKADVSVRVLKSLMEEGEIPLKILATVYRVIRRLLAAKSLEEKKSSHQDIRQELHINPYFDRNFFVHLSRFTRKQLETGLERVLHADLELKTSARPEKMILEELVLKLTGN